MTDVGAGWFEHVDPKSGCKYYAHATTRETRWARPVEATRDAPPPTGPWDEHTDPATGRTYYVNRNTRATSWSPPRDDDDEAPRSPWQSRVDEATQRTYYYHAVTRETTWTKPDGFDADDDETVALPEASPGRSAAHTKAGSAFSEGGDAASTEQRSPTPRDAVLPAGDARSETLPRDDVDVAATAARDEDVVVGPGPPAAQDDASSLRSYAERHFQLYRKGLLKSKTDLDKVLRWKADLIKQPLHRDIDRDAALAAEAVQAFRNVTGYMGDRASGKPAPDHCLKLLATAKRASALRDEVYCQILKQLTDNPSPESTAKGWALLGACLATFPPSDALAPAVRTFCSLEAEVAVAAAAVDHADDGRGAREEHEEAGDASAKSSSSTANPASTKKTPPPAAEYCLAKLAKIVASGARRELPTPAELEAIARRATVPVRVFFADGAHVDAPADSWTTATELAQHVAATLGVTASAAPVFWLFEVAPAEEAERPVDPDERVLDVVAYWRRVEAHGAARRRAPSSRATTTEAKKTASNRGPVAAFGGSRRQHAPTTTAGSRGAAHEGADDAFLATLHFQYKVRHFLDALVADDDDAAVGLLYAQARGDVVEARYPCSEQDAVTLAALQLREEQGDAPPEDEAGEVSSAPLAQLARYLPEKIIARKQDDAALRGKVLALHAKLDGYSRREARLSYLDYVRAWKLYGSSYFVAEPTARTAQGAGEGLPASVVVAINAKGVLVVDPDTKAYLREYPYARIVTWGHSATSFVLAVSQPTTTTTTTTGTDAPVTSSAAAVQQQQQQQQTKAYFKTERGDEMSALVKTYVDALSAGSSAQRAAKSPQS